MISLSTTSSGTTDIVLDFFLCPRGDCIRTMQRCKYCWIVMTNDLQGASARTRDPTLEHREEQILKMSTLNTADQAPTPTQVLEGAEMTSIVSNGAAALAAGVTFGAETNQQIGPQEQPETNQQIEQPFCDQEQQVLTPEQVDQEQTEPMHESDIRLHNVNELKRQRDEMETHYFDSYKKARIFAHNSIEELFDEAENEARNKFDRELNERSKRLDKAVEDANAQQAYHEHMTENMRRVF